MDGCTLPAYECKEDGLNENISGTPCCDCVEPRTFAGSYISVKLPFFNYFLLCE